MLRMGSKKIRNSWGHSLSHFFLQKLCQFLMARVCEECAHDYGEWDILRVLGNIYRAIQKRDVLFMGKDFVIA